MLEDLIDGLVQGLGYYKGCYKADYKGLMNMKRKPRQDSPPKYVVPKISFFYIIP